MRARIDKDNGQSPWQLIENVYTREFLAGIADRFDFDLHGAGVVRELRDAGARYILGHRLDGKRSDRKEIRDKYVRLRKATQEFKGALMNFDGYDISYDMFWAARAMREPPPSRPETDTDKPERLRGEPYHRELLRQLDILDRALSDQAERMADKGGRPSSTGLLILVTRLADFWTERVGKRFRVDYHKGAGLTEAFEFLKALLEPLDDLPDSRIVSAMRLEIKERRAHNIPT